MNESLINDILGDDIDHHVEEDGDDEEDIVQESIVARKPMEKAMYKIQSKSALASLGSSAKIQTSQGRARGISQCASRNKQVCEKCTQSKEMPEMHYAAYMGHYACLEVLLNRNGLKQVDKQERTPLFYACAANRVDCASLILMKRSDWIDKKDAQLDTIVHVCCFFGWHECLERVLQYGANPHGRNSKGFKPSHIAKNKECLELLLSYGDDLIQGDKVGRSPLFVQCARNRVDCVEFLCEWDAKTQAWMIEQPDQRGDHPIHAAACNGCSGCVEMLIYYGVDVCAKNGKGLTAMDLARTNKHDKTIKILEYALQQNKAENGNANQWTECYDPTTGQVFYYNNKTAETQWEMPVNYTSTDRPAEVWTNDAQDVVEEEEEEFVWVKKRKEKIAIVTSKSSWKPIQDPYSKAIYYQNQSTGESQWEEPDVIEQIQKEASAHATIHATELWDELNRNREDLAIVLAEDRARQLQASENQIKDAIENAVAHDVEDKFRRAALKLSLTLPQNLMRKKQSMLKMQQGPADELAEACEQDITIEMFLMAYCHVQGGGKRGESLSAAQRIVLSLFQYYATIENPQNAQRLSKTQFRTLLRDCKIVPSSAKDRDSPLKLHVADLIYVQANRMTTDDTVPSQGVEQHMEKQGFEHAISMLAERILTTREVNGEEIDVDDTIKWVVVEYFLPLARTVGKQMATYIRKCQSMYKQFLDCPQVDALFESNRSQFQAMYKYYSSNEESEYKVMTFHAMFKFASDFGILPSICTEYQLYQLFAAVNWINGHSQTVVISYEKFLQFICLMPLMYVVEPAVDPAAAAKISTFLHWLDQTNGKHNIAQAHRNAVFIKAFVTA